MTFVSYAQNFEDVILWRALKGIEKGVYVDIGAQDPLVDSVSLAFYENGWRGVHVEPNATYAARLRSARPDEVVIEAAIGNERGKFQFFEVVDTGLSTGDEAIAKLHKAAGFKIHRTKVACRPLSEILEPFRQREIHWLKIDVEGMERQVIESWQPSPVRPWIVVVESTKPNSPQENFEEWEQQLTKLGYDFMYFDGLNRFYVSRKHRELKASFGPGPNYFDGFVLARTQQAEEKLSRLEIELKSTREKFDSRVGIRDGDILNLRGELRENYLQMGELIGGIEQARHHAKMLEMRTAAIKNYLADLGARAFPPSTRPHKFFLNYFRRFLAPKWKFEQANGTVQLFTLTGKVTKIKLAFLNRGRSKTLAFEIPKPTSPRQLGAGEDDRLLGLGLHRLEIVDRGNPGISKILRFDDVLPEDIVNYAVGLSVPEGWGTWSDGDLVVLDFSEPLPEDFDMLLEASAFGPNAGINLIAYLFGAQITVIQARDENSTNEQDFEESLVSSRMESLSNRKIRQITELENKVEVATDADHILARLLEARQWNKIGGSTRT